MRDPLDLVALTAAVVPRSRVWTDIQHVSVTASTNSDVAAAARRGAAEGLVLIADHQTAGRGRLGRPWASPPGSGLAVSLLLRPRDVPIQHWSWLPLLVGVSVVNALDRLGVPAHLKWPNDVLVDAAKLAGILVERVEGMGGAAAVVGIGLNVSSRPDELPTSATSLVLAGAEPATRASVLVALLEELETAYARWRSTGGGEPQSWLRAAYRERCATLGREVRALLPGDRVLTGRAVDIDDFGRLIIEPPGGDGPLPIEAGDIIHLR